MFGKVRPGQAIRIPAADWNAAMIAAEAESRRQAKLKAGKGYSPIVETWLGQIVTAGPAEEEDYTDARYWVRRVVCVDDEGDPEDSPAFEAVEPLIEDDYTGIWVTATNLAEAVAGSHGLAADTIVLVRAIFDVQVPGMKRYWFSAGGAGTARAMFAVRCWRDGPPAGATPGSATAPCNYTYAVTSLEATAADGTDGVLYGEDMTPTKVRPAVGQLSCPGTALVDTRAGLGYYDDEAAFALYDANETLAIQV